MTLEQAEPEELGDHRGEVHLGEAEQAPGELGVVQLDAFEAELA